MKLTTLAEKKAYFDKVKWLISAKVPALKALQYPKR